MSEQPVLGGRNPPPSLETITGAGIEYQKNGRSYCFKPLLVKELGLLQRRIKQERLALIEESGLAPTAKPMARRDVICAPVTLQEMEAEVQSPTLWPYILYLSAVKSNPKIREDEFQNMEHEELLELIDVVGALMTGGTDQEAAKRASENPTEESTGDSK